MRQPIKITALGGRLALILYALAAAACVLLVYAATFRRSAPVVETVTTSAHDPASAPTPVYHTPQLPERDEEVEKAGDRIAEVEVYLKKRQSAAALLALTSARRATAHALESRRRKGSRGDELASALKGLDSVERAIQRGQYDDADRQLVALNKSLDRLGY
ncbi:MAG TPA: hypothetical protein VLJ61_08275 [Pyrinomonadaceae bacterium]|nr:hypothetical protein [Pyrinomonadaceae bacterium]